jgi:hypothetical protein
VSLGVRGAETSAVSSPPLAQALAKLVLPATTVTTKDGLKVRRRAFMLLGRRSVSRSRPSGTS